MEEPETGGRAEDIPVDGEQGEDEAGHSDETGADGKQAEENGDLGNGY